MPFLVPETIASQRWTLRGKSWSCWRQKGAKCSMSGFYVLSSASHWGEKHREPVAWEERIVSFSFHFRGADQLLNTGENVAFRCGSRMFKARRNHTRRQAEESSIVTQRGGAPGASFMLTAPSRWRHSQQTASWGSTPAEGGVIVTGKWRWLSVILEATEKFCLGYWGCSRGKNAEHGCGM